MDSTPSNGSGVRARSRKANTTPIETPTGANGQVRSTSDGASRSRQRTKTRLLAMRAPVSLPPFESYPAIAIEDVRPELDGGRWPIKRVVGDSIEVSADIFKEGHDLLQARV